MKKKRDGKKENPRVATRIRTGKFATAMTRDGFEVLPSFEWPWDVWYERARAGQLAVEKVSYSPQTLQEDVERYRECVLVELASLWNTPYPEVKAGHESRPMTRRELNRVIDH